MKKVFGKSHLPFFVTQLMIVAPMLICLVVSIVFFSIRLNKTFNKSEDLFYATLYESNDKLINGDRDFYQAQLAAVQCHDNFDEMDEEAISKKVDSFNENMQQTYDNVTAACDIVKDNKKLFIEMKCEGGMNYKELYDAFVQKYNDWLADYDLATNTGDWDKFDEDFSEARSYINDMTEILEAWATDEDKAMRDEIKHSIIVICVIFAIVTGLAILLLLATAASMSAGIKRVEHAIYAMAEGDFATPIVADSPVNEFAAIANATENMRGKMQSALTEVVKCAAYVNEGAQSTKDSVEESRRMSTDINHSVEDIANGATSMAQDVQNTSGLTINIGNSVESVLSSTESNTENGKRVYNNSEEVKRQLVELKQSGEQTNEMAKQVAASVFETAELVNEISNAAAAIIDIASQTNLLSLNASIEAARAGDAGKGFAVVAESIKNLAEESDQTAKQITGMISRIVELSEQNKELSSDIQNAAEREASELEDMVSIFDDMMNLLKFTEKGNQNILRLVESLNIDKNSVMASVDSLSAISEENAASTEETSAVLTSLTEYMDSIVEQANAQKEAAESLQRSISAFKIH